MKEKRYIKSKNKFNVWLENDGKCNFCSKELLSINDDNKKITMENIGEIAHIISFSSNKTVRNRQVQRNAIDKRFNECKTKGDHLDFWSKEDLKYVDDAINCSCNLTLLCNSCHKKFDHGQLNYNVKEEIRNALIVEEPDNDTYEKIFQFIDRKKTQMRSTKNFSPLITIWEEDDKGNRFYNNDTIINIVKEYDDSASIIVDPFSNNLLEFKEIYENFYKKYNLKEVNQIKWESFKQNLKKINEINYVAKFIYRNDSGNKGSWWITFEKKDFYNLKNEIKNDKLLKKNIDKFFESNKFLSKKIYNENFSNPDKTLKEKPEFEIISNILMNQLKKYADYRSNDAKYFNSFTIAYFARWGTGKTSLIRTIADELKDFYNCVEINLWNISNIISDELKNEDDSFVRHIVKESITQLINNPDYVKLYMDSSRKFSINKEHINLKYEMINSIIGIKGDNEANVLEQRSKFIDQFIMNLQNAISTVFELTLKPTIFIFDDIDRINESDKIVRILDSIVTFLNLKNCVFIFPVDESKIINALNDKKPNLDPLQYINKYFNYSIRSSFIPKIDNITMIKSELSRIVLDINDEKSSLNDNLLRFIANFIDSSHRATKDFINALSFNTYSLWNNITNSEHSKKFIETVFEKNKANHDIFVSNMKDYILMFSSIACIVQSNFPLLIDFVSEDIDNLRHLIKWFKNWDESQKNISEFLNDNNINNINKNILLSIFGVSKKENIIDNKKLNSINDEKYTKVINLKNIFNKLNIFSISSDEYILFWLALTLSKINNDTFIDFLRLSIIGKEISDKKRFFDYVAMNDEWSENLVDYFEKLDLFIENNFIKEDDVNLVINNLLDEEINVLINNKLNDEQRKKIYNNKLIIFSFNLSFNNLLEINDEYLNRLIIFINNYNYHKSFKILSRKQIDIERFEILLNKIDDLDDNLIIFDYLDINNEKDKTINCKNKITFNLFKKLNELTFYKICYEHFPDIKEENENLAYLIENIKLINDKNLYDNIFKLWKNGLLTNELIFDFNFEYFNDFIFHISNNLDSLYNVNIEKVQSIIIESSKYYNTKTINNEDKNKLKEFVKSLIKIFNWVIDVENNFSTDYFIYFIYFWESLLNSWNQNIDDDWNIFILNFLEKNIDSNLLDAILDFYNRLENINVNNHIFMLILNQYFKTVNNEIIVKESKKILELDEIMNSTILRENCLKKINKFNIDFAYSGMLFYGGVDINDIKNNRIHYNNTTKENKKIQIELLTKHLDELKYFSLYILYKDSNENLRNFIKEVVEDNWDDLLDKFDPKYIIDTNDQDFYLFLNNYYNECIVEYFLNQINCNEWEEFNKWYNSAVSILKDLINQYEKIFLVIPKTNIKINEFFSYIKKQIDIFENKKERIVEWFCLDDKGLNINNVNDLEKIENNLDSLIDKYSKFLMYNISVNNFQNIKNLNDYICIEIEKIKNKYYSVFENENLKTRKKINKKLYLLNDIKNNIDSIIESFNDIASIDKFLAKNSSDK